MRGETTINTIRAKERSGRSAVYWVIFGGFISCIMWLVWHITIKILRVIDLVNVTVS